MIKEYIDKNKGEPMTKGQAKFLKWLQLQVHNKTITIEQAKKQWKSRYP